MDTKDIQNRWLNQDQLYKEYGLSKATQSKYRLNRSIPFSKINKFIRYDRIEIDKWLEGAKVEVING